MDQLKLNGIEVECIIGDLPEERVNEQLPILPIYSNVYFDFFTNLLHDYDISESSTWGEASIGAVKAEIPKVEIEEADLDGGKIEIG